MKHHNPETIREAIAARRFSQKMKAALSEVAAGASYRRAADRAGVDHRDLHHNAKTVPGLVDLHLKEWERSLGPAFPQMWRHHLERREKAA